MFNVLYDESGLFGTTAYISACDDEYCGQSRHSRFCCLVGTSIGDIPHCEDMGGLFITDLQCFPRLNEAILLNGIRRDGLQKTRLRSHTSAHDLQDVRQLQDSTTRGTVELTARSAGTLEPSCKSTLNVEPSVG